MRRSRSPKAGVSGGIKVRVERRAGGIVAVRVAGHAGYAPRGDDIVCAGVSALIQAAAHGLRTHTNSSVRIVDGRGDYSIEVDRTDAAGRAILATALDGIKAIARSHPAHVRVSSGRAAGIQNAASKGRVPSSRPTRSKGA